MLLAPLLYRTIHFYAVGQGAGFPPSPADLVEQNAASWQQPKQQEVSPADLVERKGQQQHKARE
jgi:hypothetical protein